MKGSRHSPLTSRLLSSLEPTTLDASSAFERRTNACIDKPTVTVLCQCDCDIGPVIVNAIGQQGTRLVAIIHHGLQPSRVTHVSIRYCNANMRAVCKLVATSGLDCVPTLDSAITSKTLLPNNTRAVGTSLPLIRPWILRQHSLYVETTSYDHPSSWLPQLLLSNCSDRSSI